MNIANFTYRRPFSSTDSVNISVTTPGTNQFLIIDQINVVDEAGNGGAFGLKIDGSSIFKDLTLKENGNLILPGILRVESGAAVTIDVTAGLAVTIGGSTYGI